MGLPAGSVIIHLRSIPTEVKQVITRITPKTFFPIHPELYARFVSGVTKVQLAEKNKTAVA